MVVLPRESHSWLLSSPLTAIFSRMHLSSPRRSQEAEKDSTMAKEDVELRTATCQVSSDDFQDNCSLSCYGSEESDSWVMEDLFKSPYFDRSFDKSHSSVDSSTSQLEEEEEIWRWFWDADNDMVSPEPLLYPVTPGPISVRDQGQLGITRDLPLQSHIESTDPRKTPHLKRTSAVRSPRRITRAREVQVETTAKALYSPLSPGAPTIPNLHQDYHTKCFSFPTSKETRARPQRSRAYTAPAPAGPPLHRSEPNIHAVTNNRSHPSPTAISVSMLLSSAPPSPRCPLMTERDLMDLMNETSAFSDDEDEEDGNEDEHDAPAFVLAMRSVLALGRSTSSAEDEKFQRLPVEKAKRKGPKRTLSGALNFLFNKKKGATM